MRINLPNQITIGRLFMAIIFFSCLGRYDARAAEPKLWLLDLCAGLFLVAAITDVIDGYLARKHNQVTSFGRVIDPFVDKVLVIGAYAFLAGDGFVDAAGRKISDVAMWMVVVIFGRELLVTSLRGVSEAGGQAFGADVYGKMKMLLQVITVMWVLISLAHPGLGFPGTFIGVLCDRGRPVMVYLTVVVTLLSMGSYLWRARAVLTHTSVATR